LLYGDESGLRRAVFNLLLNAVHEIGQGGRLEITIEDSADKPGFTMIVFAAVEKDGEGHDFSRSLAGFLSRNEGGSSMGMGLSLTRKVLREFGAEVDTLAPAGRGAPLVVFLPKKNGGHGVVRQ
jgi:signal transduction histidine kinase